MPSYVTPKKNTAFILYTGLPDAEDSVAMKDNPTISAGDFKVSKDGGALANLASLPVVTPSSSKLVKISLSASEMNADNVTIIGSDPDGEWCDIVINIQTSESQIDDLAKSSEIKTKVVEALVTDTYAEPGQGAPPATTSLVNKIGYLYKAFRNKITQTANTFSLYADDGTTVDQKAAVDDDGTTFTRGEIGSGP